MSYQVLARKWRPGNFHEMVGQEHVLRALINALDHNRLHHAYLFTGTRGVGKTTIARILAKCLNCEVGVSSSPCGQCASCLEIAQGRFIDLIEVDAASRTKVEDTRELLENVQYAPTRGRYKVYLIDEVHMLSGHSFNALLKTLEEPPPHVKFLLATTDPQKLPVTILSRCLQFHLKNMSQERIVGHLTNVLSQEEIPTEESALWQLARAADGSMRDALSLTDQAIAFGNGTVTDNEVSAMLGTIDRSFVYDILTALADLDSVAVLNAVAAMSEQSPDFAGALAEVISVLHRIALAQVAPQALDNSLGDRDQVIALAAKISSEDVQLFYQIALHGRRDLPFNPDARSGFEMTLLRMLAFKPQGVVAPPKQALPSSNTSVSNTPVSSPAVSNTSISSASASNSAQANPIAKPDSPELSATIGSEKKTTPVDTVEFAVPPVKPEITAAKPEAISEVINPQTPAPELAGEESSSAAQIAPAVTPEPPKAEIPTQAPQQSVAPAAVKSPEAQPTVSQSTASQSATARPNPAQSTAVAPADVPSEYDEYASIADDFGSDDSGANDSKTNNSRTNDSVAVSGDTQSAAPSPVQSPRQPQHAPKPVSISESAPSKPEPKKQSLLESIQAQAPIPAPTESIPRPAVDAPLNAVDTANVGDAVGESNAEDAKLDKIAFEDFSPSNWLAVYPQLSVNGILQSTVSNCVYLGRSGDQLNFLLDKPNAALYSEGHQERFAELLSQYFARSVTVVISLGDVTDETPAIQATRLKHERHQQAVNLVQSDPLVQQLVNQFSVVIDPEKIEPLA